MSLDALYDLLASSPEGVTVTEMQSKLKVTHSQAKRLIRDMRIWLGDDKDINLICEPQGEGERWLYHLVGQVEEGRWYFTNRLGDAETRLETLHAISRSIKEGTDGRTLEGRKAAAMERGLRHLIENLQAMGGNG